MCRVPQKMSATRVKYIAAAMCFVSVAGFASAMPFLQAKREEVGCSSLCMGSMTSLRSALSLLGAPLVGRASDKYGRRVAMLVAAVATLASALISAWAPSLQWLWVGIVPAALLSHQYDLLKATLADAYEDVSAAVLSGAQGTLGMSAGLGFLGVALGGLFADAWRASMVALVAFVCSVAGTMALPKRKHKTSKVEMRSADSAEPVVKTAGGIVGSLRQMASLPSARSSAGLLLLSLRFLMGMAFHLFMSIWQTSLKTRFPNFGASDHARFMTFIGGGYALSQGLSRLVLGFADRKSMTPALLVLCCLALSLGRVAAVNAPTIPLVYVSYAPVIAALGVMNAALTGAAGRVAPPNERGGFIGTLSAVESVCGIFGPVFGGLLSLRGDSAVLGIVLGLYVTAAVAIFLNWRNCVNDSKAETDVIKKKKKKKKKEAPSNLRMWHLAFAYLAFLGLVLLASYYRFDRIARLAPPPPPPPPLKGIPALLSNAKRALLRIPFLQKFRKK